MKDETEKMPTKEPKRKQEMSLKQATIVSIVSGVVILLLNNLLFVKLTQVYAIVNMMAAVIILAVPLSLRYEKYRRIKKLELLFPKYLKDLSEDIATGMTLPQAMKAAARNEYDVLTPHVKSLSAKVEWGVPFENALLIFAKNSGSKFMKRNVQTIIEAHRSGGKTDTVLRSVAQSLQDLERIKKERASSIYAQMINGYLIYVIFLGVMVGLATILVPAFTSFGGTGQTKDLQEAFMEIFRALTVIQGVFAGLAIGKMAEGTMMAGIKHALALTIFGYSAFIIFT
jgi:archaeal flagellar protein FlaJ